MSTSDLLSGTIVVGFIILCLLLIASMVPEDRREAPMTQQELNTELFGPETRWKIAIRDVGMDWDKTYDNFADCEKVRKFIDGPRTIFRSSCIPYKQ